MVAAWALHFIACVTSVGSSREKRRHSWAWASAATNRAASLASAAVTGSREATWAIASRSRRAMASGSSPGGAGGSEVCRVWISIQ